MKELPCLEEIYDFETEQLEHILQEIDQALVSGANGQHIELPKGFESYDRFERKALKLKEHLELELDERRQVDDVISFFVGKSSTGIDLLNDDQFYQPLAKKEQQQQQNDQQMQQIMSRYNQEHISTSQSSKTQQMQQQQQQKYLNEQNLESLTKTSNPFLKQNNQSELQSQYGDGFKQQSSTDLETQSQFTANTNDQVGSELSKQMFAARSNPLKNKKDLQAFMKEKLAKTKISSEATSQIQPIAQINKNFVKKKPTAYDDSMSDTKSVISKTTTEKSTSIYKPNLKKKESTTNAQTQSRAPRQKEEQPVIKKRENVKSSLTRQSSGVKENKRSVTDSKDKEKTSQSKLESGSGANKTQQNIFKPNNMKPSQSRQQSSRPPIPKGNNNNNNNAVGNVKNTQNNEQIESKVKLIQHEFCWSQLQQVNKNVQLLRSHKIGIDNTTKDYHEDVNKWDDQQQQQDDHEEDQFNGLNQEEIQSKYSDNDLEDQMNDYKASVIDEKLDNIDVNIKSKQKYTYSTTKSQPSQLTTQRQESIDITERKENEQEVVEQSENGDVEQDYDDNEEEKVNQNEYGNEDDQDQDEEEEFYQPLTNQHKQIKTQKPSRKHTHDSSEDQSSNNTDNIDNSHKKQEKKLEQMAINTQQEKQLEIDTMQAESTTSKKIRGKVQIFVDEAALSAQQTPAASNHSIQIDQDSYNQKQSEIEKQLKLLEQQDKEMREKILQKGPSKKMEALQKIINQDEAKRKQEQEERLKQIREEMKKEKEEQDKNAKTTATTVLQSAQKEQKADNKQEQLTTEQTKQQQQSKEQNEPNSEKQKPKKGKKGVSKQQQLVTAVPRQQFESDQVIDYSTHYKTFYDIFVGNVIDPKNFDLQYTIRDTRNMYAAFVNIMEVNSLQMKKKFQFEQAPLEKSLVDHYSVMPNFFTLTGKSVNELELEFKNKNNELMQQAMAQMQLKNRFQELKQKDVNDIVKEATEKAGASNQSSLVELDRESSLFYRVVKNRTEVYDIISRAFSRKKRWNELPHGLDLRNSWNLLWTWSKIKIDISKLLVWQRCNHFSGAKNVSRKDFLKRNIERAQKMSAKANQVFNISPTTFILPKEYVGFLECFSELEDKEGKMNYWIMKPAAKSRGRGISLVNDLSQITYGEPIVVQRYIKNPLLINGYKFDMRIYVVVTSVNPLECFLYKDGFGRFSTIPFSLDPTDKNNKYIHLTNVSIQKYNVNNSDQDSSDLLYGGTKISIQTLRKRFQSATNVSWDEVIWPQIREVIVKSMVACQNDIQYNPCSFELFGYDIMIDSDYKCWLIEINSSPSLARDTLLDDMIKQRLIDDIIDLVDPLDFDRKRLFEVLERRINEDFKQSTTTNQYSKRLMNRDLTYILNGQVPRKYGEMPKLMGNFERLAPSPMSESYLKLIGGQKILFVLMELNRILFPAPPSSYTIKGTRTKVGHIIYIPRKDESHFDYDKLSAISYNDGGKFSQLGSAFDLSSPTGRQMFANSNILAQYSTAYNKRHMMDVMDDKDTDFQLNIEELKVEEFKTAREDSRSTFSQTQKIETKSVASSISKNLKLPIPCLYLPSTQGSSKLLLYFHRNGEDIGQAEEFLDTVRSFLRINVLAMEFPGYGIYDGKPNAKQILRDSENVYEFMTQIIGVPESSILILGRSIGTGPACYVAARYNPGCLIMISSFKSIKDIAKEQCGRYIGSLLTDRFNNLQMIEQVSCPTFFVHGQADKFISYKHTEELYLKCGGQAAFIKPKDMDHNEFDLIRDFIKPFNQFLKQVKFDLEPKIGEATSINIPKELFQVPPDFPTRPNQGSLWNWIFRKFASSSGN